MMYLCIRDRFRRPYKESPCAKAKLTGAACKDVMARKTRIAAPVSSSRWIAAGLTPLHLPLTARRHTFHLPA